MNEAGWVTALVSMPFVSAFHPSIQLGLLSACAERVGFRTETLHLGLDFAKQLGMDCYALLSEHRGRLTGDWLFSVEAFGEDAPDPSGEFLQEFRNEIGGGSGLTPARLMDIRNSEIPIYLEYLVSSIPWQDYRIVGFTSTFQQNAASIALATRIKRKFPKITIVFGGANLEAPMGLEMVRSFDVIDFAIIGEGDYVFPAFLSAVEAGHDPATLPGVACRRDGNISYVSPDPPVRLMDDLPIPLYDEYFRRAEALGLLPKAGRRDVEIPFESARGCWWGAKHHCTFCGLNGSSMVFRHKSAERVEHELSVLNSRYKSFRFFGVDNIMEHSYFKSLLPALAASRSDYSIHYEVKSNLSREHIRLLSESGIDRIQPGIESLSTHVLALMKKGVTAIQNVNTLRWAEFYGIKVSWNLIWGFPGETKEDYVQQAQLFPLLVHLQPPGDWGRIWVERFSPIFGDRREFPSLFVTPEASYRFVYPRSVNLDSLAYFFDAQLENTLPSAAYTDFKDQARLWSEGWSEEPHPTLHYWLSPLMLQIEDKRGDPGIYTFHEPLRSIYLICSESPVTAQQVVRAMKDKIGRSELDDVLSKFCERGLMMRDGSQFLSLALPRTRRR